MKKTSINSKLIMILLVVSTNIAYCQWSPSLFPNPIWTNQNVGIGLSSPLLKLHIKTDDQEQLSDLQSSLALDNRQLRLSYTKTSNGSSLFQSGFGGTPVVTEDFDWDIVNEHGYLNFKVFDNLTSTSGYPFLLDMNSGRFMSNLKVDGNTNLQTTTATDFTATNISATNLNVDNINISKLTIGTLRPISNAFKNYSLSVNGDIVSRKAVVQVSDWADKVFQKNYRLMSLSEIEAFVSKYKHLPEIPSEAEVLENGVDVGEMNKLLLQKVEELTLHLIEQDKKIKVLEAKVK